MLKSFLCYYKPYKRMLTLDLLAAIGVSGLWLCYPILTRQMIDVYIPNQDIEKILLLGGILLVAYAIRMGLDLFMQYTGHMIGAKIQTDMRMDLFNKVQRLPCSYLDKNKTTSVLTGMVNSLEQIVEFAHHIPTDMLSSVLILVGSFVYLLSVDVFLALVIFACLPLLAIVLLTTKKKMYDAFIHSRLCVGEINAATQSSVTGLRVTKAYGNEQIEREKFIISSAKLMQAHKKAYHILAKYISSSNFLIDLFNVAVLVVGGIELYRGNITFGDFSVFVLSKNLFITPINTIVLMVELYQRGMTGFRRFQDLMEQPEECDAPNAVDIPHVRGEVEFRDVSFGYHEGEDIFSGLSFQIPAGQTLAVVGASGGGKTTICNLLMRFYEPTSGQILIDGKDVGEVSLSSLRKHIGMVEQDAFLFSGSVADNILYGRPDATHEQVVSAATKANIHEFIMSQPQGYDTDIGEGGIRLSLGQKQRISIARMFLKNPEIILLDEATSSIDQATETQIHKELEVLCRDKTTIVVTHKLSTARGADRIIVVGGDGDDIEDGTHEELLQRGGAYKRLHDGGVITADYIPLSD